MNTQTILQPDRATPSSWLKSYYFTRAGVSTAWVAAAFTVGKTVPPVAAALLVAYPAWDAVANFVDAQRSGGLKMNPSQALNVVVSAITAIAVAVAVGETMNMVVAVFGTWAILSGVFQLITAVRRRKAGAQWAMIVSGAQSALAGAFFIKRSFGAEPLSIADLAPYALVGAVYFLVSAVWLTVAAARKA